MKSLFLTQDEVAEELGVARSTVHKWVQAGLLPAVQWGARKKRIPREALERFREQLVEQALEQTCVR